MIELESSELGTALPPRMREALAREWDRLARPGPMFTGAQRVAIAAAARAVRAGGGEAHRTQDLTDAAVEAARVLSAAPGEASADLVAGLEARGLDRLTYLEVVGVVARTSAVDACLFGLEVRQAPLPEPVEGPATGETDPRAGIGNAWVPTVGNVSAGGALSALPAENAASDDLHDAFYIPRAHMKEADYSAELSRAQMELIASRVSYLNGCHY